MVSARRIGMLLIKNRSSRSTLSPRWVTVWIRIRVSSLGQLNKMSSGRR
jgi:hypothetical protein